MSVSQYYDELVQIIKVVSHDTNLPEATIFNVVEDAIKLAASRKYGSDNDIVTNITKDGRVTINRKLEIVSDEDFKNNSTQISYSQALQEQGEPVIGEFILEPLPPIALDRVAAKIAEQVIAKTLNEAEKQRQYDEYKDRVGDLVSGIVKRLDNGDIIVTIGHSNEAVIYKNSVIKGESFKVGDRISAHIQKVVRDNARYQIILSRTSNEFLGKLFAQEVPEVYDKIVEIVAIAREAGSRAKIAVTSHDSNIDPVGACVGVRGSRINSIINELNGEKIDVISYTDDTANFILHALSPAQISKVVIDEENKRVDVIVPEDQLSITIGRRGQNVRLASILTGWIIDVMTDDEESKRRANEFKTLSDLFINALNIEDVIGHLLVTEGFTSLEDIAYVPLEEIASIEGFDEDIAAALKERAQNYLENKENEINKIWQEAGVSSELLDLPDIDTDAMVVFANNAIKTIDDVADLSRDEFKEFFPSDKYSDEKIDNIIMTAREKWFSDTDNDGEIVN
ncbi:MAG: transcription termination factor NusA [Pseudomonadota bacterium]